MNLSNNYRDNMNVHSGKKLKILTCKGFTSVSRVSEQIRKAAAIPERTISLTSCNLIVFRLKILSIIVCILNDLNCLSVILIIVKSRITET